MIGTTDDEVDLVGVEIVEGNVGAGSGRLTISSVTLASAKAASHPTQQHPLHRLTILQRSLLRGNLPLQAVWSPWVKVLPLDDVGDCVRFADPALLSANRIQSRRRCCSPALLTVRNHHSDLPAQPFLQALRKAENVGGRGRWRSIIVLKARASESGCRLGRGSHR